MTYNSEMSELDRNRVTGEPFVDNFQQRYQIRLGKRLAPLGEETPRALDVVSAVVSSVVDPQIRENVQSDLVFRVLDGTTDFPDFKRRILGFAADLEKRKVTLGGHPINLDTTSD